MYIVVFRQFFHDIFHEITFIVGTFFFVFLVVDVEHLQKMLCQIQSVQHIVTHIAIMFETGIEYIGIPVTVG